MEAERAAELKKVLPKLVLGLVGVELATLPIFRSGGRTGLSFWQWVVNHTIFGPPVEYLPREDYGRELEGIFPWYPVKQHVQTFATMEDAMAYFKTDQVAVEDLVKNGAISIVVGTGHIQRGDEYDDLLADVRNDGRFHSIRSLVQPNAPDVRDVAQVLVQAPDFINAAQMFVNSFTTYSQEVGDYWRTPGETLDEFTKYREEIQRFGSAVFPECDCDDMAILLCSILRNYMPPDKVYCAFGLWTLRGETTGHMWVVTEDETGEDRILEATAGPERPGKGKYILYGMFNDRYAFATDAGLKEFDLKVVQLAELALRR